jgi:AcrR family transcriptional regulator
MDHKLNVIRELNRIIPLLEMTLSKSERKHRNQRLMMIQAARDLFEMKPYDEVSMEDIAHEAAVSKQTLYNYFGSKESIYLGIGVEGFKDLFDRIDELGLPAFSGKEQTLKLGEDLFNELASEREHPLNIEISRRFVTIYNQLGGLTDEILQKRVENEDRRRKKKSIEDVLADYWEQVWKYEEYWMKAIERGFEDGSISSNLDADRLINYSRVLIHGVVDHMQVRRKLLDRAELSQDQVREITLRLLANLLENEV